MNRQLTLREQERRRQEFGAAIGFNPDDSPSVKRDTATIKHMVLSGKSADEIINSPPGQRILDSNDIHTIRACLSATTQEPLSEHEAMMIIQADTGRGDTDL